MSVRTGVARWWYACAGLLCAMNVFATNLPPDAAADHDAQSGVSAVQDAACAECVPPEVSAPQRVSLTEVAWALSDGGDPAAESADAPPVIHFMKSNRFVGTGSCGDFFGTYEVNEDGRFKIRTFKAKKKCDQYTPTELRMSASLIMVDAMSLDACALSMYANSESVLSYQCRPDESLEKLAAIADQFKLPKKIKKPKAATKKSGKSKNRTKKTAR